ncbi:MAG: Arsenite efflux rane protein ArsB [Frankiales bacterium]|nr:Arsenite efflux rane protein ArsB [Frankiales bacterium]
MTTVWAVLGVAGVLVVLTGWLPGSEAHDVALTRGGPVLGFLVAITVLAELADRAGVFDAAAGVCARAARGSTLRLFLLISVLGTLTTIGMSLDTTAVLLTPVVLTLTDRLGLRPLPFALLAVWLANTASLLLPVSNLTNLLAVQSTGLSTPQFAARMALPALVAVLITVGYLGVLYRRDLRTRYEPPPVEPIADGWTFWVCAGACVLLAPGVLAGGAPWAVAVVCAGAAVLVFGIRDRRQLVGSLLPWRLVILTEGLFLVVSAVARHGGSRLLGDLAGHSTLATAGVAASASNLVNNLPAYLAIEPAVGAGNTTQHLSVLLGTNGGPLVLLWGSLATLLWRERCRARGVKVKASTFAAVGLGGVPLIILGTTAALLVTS